MLHFSFVLLPFFFFFINIFLLQKKKKQEKLTQILKHRIFFSLQNIQTILFDLPRTSFTLFIKWLTMIYFHFDFTKKIILLIFNSKELTNQLYMMYWYQEIRQAV